MRMSVAVLQMTADREPDGRALRALETSIATLAGMLDAMEGAADSLAPADDRLGLRDLVAAAVGTVGGDRVEVRLDQALPDVDVRGCAERTPRALAASVRAAIDGLPDGGMLGVTARCREHHVELRLALTGPTVVPPRRVLRPAEAGGDWFTPAALLAGTGATLELGSADPTTVVVGITLPLA